MTTLAWVGTFAIAAFLLLCAVCVLALGKFQVRHDWHQQRTLYLQHPGAREQQEAHIYDIRKARRTGEKFAYILFLILALIFFLFMVITFPRFN